MWAAMTWDKIQPTPSMTQTMVLDNQYYPEEGEVREAIKMQAIFFDKLLINRAFILNNPDLVSIVKNYANNGFNRLMESGAIAIVMVERGTTPSFIEEWKDAKSVEMWGLTDDERYINWLNQFIEGVNNPVPYLTFDYSIASQNYLSLIKNYWNTLSELKSLSNFEPDDKKHAALLDDRESLIKAHI